MKILLTVLCLYEDKYFEAYRRTFAISLCCELAKNIVVLLFFYFLLF